MSSDSYMVISREIKHNLWVAMETETTHRENSIGDDVT